MPDNQETNISNVIAQGDVAGGNIYNYAQSSTPLSQLYEDFQKEIEEGGEPFQDIIEKLQHWKDSDSPEPEGVEKKLKDGDRPELVDMGLRAKEQFSKVLLKHQYSKAAQFILSYLLGKVWNSFSFVIIPRIKEGAPSNEIDLLIQEHVVGPIEEILGSNPLAIDPSEIQGMIYFLTGNCHLKWK